MGGNEEVDKVAWIGAAMDRSLSWAFHSTLSRIQCTIEFTKNTLAVGEWILAFGCHWLLSQDHNPGRSKWMTNGGRSRLTGAEWDPV